jgi:hypothetical protein
VRLRKGGGGARASLDEQSRHPLQALPHRKETVALTIAARP